MNKRAMKQKAKMRRTRKAMLLLIRHQARNWRRWHTYYWADAALQDLYAVHVMPGIYYRWLFRTCMWLASHTAFHRLADRAIHTIPLAIRFEAA